MMTFLAIAARNERDHEEEKELLRIQIRLLTGYRDDLEDVIRHDSAHYAIAVEMLAGLAGINVDDMVAAIGKRYEREQKAGVAS